MLKKQCRICLEWWPPTPDYFHRAKANKDGLKTECKLCASERETKEYRERKERINGRND